MGDPLIALDCPTEVFFSDDRGLKRCCHNIGITYTMGQVMTMSTPNDCRTTLIISAGLRWRGECRVAKSIETLGARITALRKDKGMTQRELAEQLSVSQPVVSDYENDVIRLPADTVVTLARVLGVTADELLGLKVGAASMGAIKNRRLLRRVQAIDQLSKRDQEALLRTIDAFLSKAS